MKNGNDKKRKNKLSNRNGKFRRSSTTKPFFRVIEKYFDWDFVYDE